MKSLILLFTLLTCSFAFCTTTYVYGQAETNSSQTYLIIKNDGSRYIGVIISQDAREVLIRTRELGEIIIPKHEIREMRPLSEDEVTADGKIKVSDAFATRYYLSTNAMALSKGDNYIIWNLYGPDIQFGLSDNFGVGLMTSWIGSPIIGSAKYSVLKNEKVGFAVGTLLGTGSWASPEYGLAVPFGSFTYGSIDKNISISLGYGSVWGDGESDGASLISIAGMNRVSERISLVFDSFIIGPENDFTSALIIPAIRLHSDPNKAFQIGFAGVAAEGEVVPLPLPFLQWYRKF